MKIISTFLIGFFLFYHLVFANEIIKYQYDDLIRELTNLQPDQNNIFQIQDLFLEKEGSAFIFEEGEFYFFKQINNLIRVGVFIGDGVFSFTPPLDIERRQLASYTGNSVFEKKFNTLLIFFTDSTFDLVKNNFYKTNGSQIQKAQEIYQNSLKYIYDTTMKVIDNIICSSFLNQDNNRMFISQINDEFLFATETYYYVVDPFQKEEISFFKANWVDEDKYDFDLITSFDWPDDYPENRDIYKSKINIYNYDITCSISDTTMTKYETTMEFVSKVKNLGWLSFQIYDEMTIDSIVDKAGNNIEFCKKKNDNYLLINLKNYIYDSSYIKFFYHHDNPTLILIKDIFEIYSTIVNFYRKKIIYDDFFPRYSLFDESEFKINFKYPEKYKICSIGKKIMESIEGSTVNSTWVTKKKISNPIYCFGSFQEKIVEGDSIVPKIVFYFKSPFFVDSVLKHIQDSYLFYSKLFGKRKSEILYAVEISGDVSYAFDDIIALSNIDLKDSTRIIFDESSCAHEIAHQWWGVDIDRKSYRDTWLSEGLSEYCRLLYKKNNLKDTNFFYRYLDVTRKLLLNFNSTMTKFVGEPPKPISLGFRSSSRVRPLASYYINIYIRGAWIFHMLNTFLTNFESDNDTQFIEIMKDYYNTFKNQKQQCWILFQ